jgi:NAD(P)-dependent dehydrogenase (short-subunit alcohol dehydrogenase family)
MPRHVLVTGAGSGIGAGVCSAFAALGDRVTGADVRRDALDAVLARIAREHGTPTAALVCDLADAAAAERLVSDAWDRHGAVDVLVNAAGIYPATPFLNLSAAAWDQVQHVNVRAPMLTTVDFGRRAADAGRGGCVVNISSGAALRARPGAAHYCSSKAAVEMLTRAAAIELGGHGIRVNAVSPGFVEVDSLVNPVTPEYAEAVSPNPLGRRGQPADIAAAVVWLASDAAAWISGSILRVDGGASAGTTALPLHWPELTEVQRGARPA